MGADWFLFRFFLNKNPQIGDQVKNFRKYCWLSFKRFRMYVNIYHMICIKKGKESNNGNTTITPESAEVDNNSTEISSTGSSAGDNNREMQLLFFKSLIFLKWYRSQGNKLHILILFGYVTKPRLRTGICKWVSLSPKHLQARGLEPFPLLH